MDLTSEAIKKIEDMAVLANDSKAVSVQIEQGRARVFNSRTGGLSFVPIPSQEPNITVLGVVDIHQALTDYGSAESSLWISANVITLFFNDQRIGKAALPLRINPAIEALKTMKEKTPQQLRRILRVDLFGSDQTPEDFCNVISNLKFESLSTTDVKLTKGDESIGKNVRSKVTAEADIPEHVSFDVNVYPDLSDIETNVQIHCAVITEPLAGTVSVIPYPGELEKAVAIAINRIAEHLRELDPDWIVYCGTCV